MVSNERNEDLDKIASIMVHEIPGDVSRALDAMACYHSGLQRECFFYFKFFLLVVHELARPLVCGLGLRICICVGL
ncbi:hypothetical protein HBI56_115990 [Parastagonospora nodorum]|uniref:Uncharacterized protein n=1 Tax=Phaeosphaeria nodorum (strain SN15 / ATCC MYA-4574 / FGSC 10173) TaxID=321614 RepID=A0A7U2FCR9_PHANO|nr:hypothetical protein HBH56_238610 [Parastagonospora nodorum]QRD00655.1 hypothetical protein JI435_415570 [Parastagonospora nodorum SN15]KAH3925854.1 hypothetical protein HBH54_177400 [Parastagonospora nodorum]KAH3953167.1 hypothetical protein HBH53_038770 [Parastagonospora nodorum]KAH3976491.1 hypothetical protein HBH52_119880 [Parastagonospora nodorum]